jgi:hypothetical protein
MGKLDTVFRLQPRAGRVRHAPARPALPCRTVRRPKYNGYKKILTQIERGKAGKRQEYDGAGTGMERFPELDNMNDF